MEEKVFYHTRHIPIEHILTESPMGKSVVITFCATVLIRPVQTNCKNTAWI